MATSAELVRAYRGQADLEADEAVAWLVDFLSTYGMTESVIAALCELIDDEGMTADLVGQLKENGLVIDEEQTPANHEDLPDDEVE